MNNKKTDEAEAEMRNWAFEQAEALSGVGHWLLNLETNALHWSPQVYRIHGVTPDEYTPELSSAVDFYHPDDRQSVLDFVRFSIERAKDFEFSLRLVRKDGRIADVHTRAKCFVNEQGKVIKLFGVFQDASSQLLQSASRAHRTDTQKSLIDMTSDGYWDWYIPENYQYMSPRFWHMLGYRPEEMSQTPNAAREQIIEADKVTAIAALDDFISAGGQGIYENEVRFKHKEGSIVTVVCRGEVVERDAQGHPIRMIGTHTDVTEVRAKEARLKASLDFQRLLMDANTDIIFVKDRGFRIVEGNKAFFDTFDGRPRDTIIGFTTIESFSEEEARDFNREDLRAFEEGSSEVTETIKFPDGRERTLLTKKIRFNDHDRPLILGVARDVTEIKQTEANLLQANDELREFAYRTSHDLRAPLISSRKLLGITSKLIQQGKMGRVTQHIETIDHTLLSLEQLLSTILKLSVLQNSDEQEAFFDIETLLQSVIGKLRQALTIDLSIMKTEISGEKKIKLSALHVEHVLENLLSNAYKFRRKANDDKILLNIQTNVNELKIIVEDNGLGISEEYQTQVFTMFKRFHPRLDNGSGLGLYLVKRCCEKLGGSIHYEPLSQGSRFTVLLPHSGKRCA